MCAAHDPDEAFGAARMSPQRRAIISAANGILGAFTVEELVRATLSQGEAIGTATVYRAVAALEASGWLERVGERGGSILYARCHVGGRHHHHVVCESCGRVEATECPVTIATDTQAAGFRVTRHEVSLYGICPDCSASDARKA